MLREIGDKAFPIWLLGDSNPRNWANDLNAPFDSRHPARHNIWTAVLDVMQDQFYRVQRRRIDTSALYIRNAVEDATAKPPLRLLDWPADLNREVVAFRGELQHCSPTLLFSFGAFACEFARRALGYDPRRAYGSWGARALGDEFRTRVATFRPGQINWVPLLHISISGGRFLPSHQHFCGRAGANYFDEVGLALARAILKHSQDLPIWI